MKLPLRFTVICLFVLFTAHMLYAAEVSSIGKGNDSVQFQLEKKIDAQIKDMLLPDALAVLLKDTGITYTVDPSVAQLKVTADFKGVSLQQALTELERVSNTLIGMGTGGVGGSISIVKGSWFTGPNAYVYVLKRPDPSMTRESQFESKDVMVPNDAHAIQLKYYTPVDMLLMLEVINWEDFLSGKTIAKWTKGPVPYPNLLPREITSIYLRPDTKALFVTGKEAAVAELTQLISKIDVEPRQVSIHITRYQLGAVTPKSIELKRQGGGVEMSSPTESQLDALTSELRDKGIKPIVTANIPAFGAFPVEAKINWRGAESSMPVHTIDLLVTPRLNPTDNSVFINIYIMYAMADEPKQPSQSTGFSGAASLDPGRSVLMHEPSDSMGGGALTIITATM